MISGTDELTKLRCNNESFEASFKDGLQENGLFSTIKVRISLCKLLPRMESETCPWVEVKSS